MKKYGIGIDFGTTNSLMCVYDSERNEFRQVNKDPTSSTVWYKGGEIIVGEEAREHINTLSGQPGHYFEKSIKLKLGTDYSANIFGKKTSPVLIASEIIKCVKDKAINKSGIEKLVDENELRRAVFTVPINFSGKARKDLRGAANEAGMEISTFIHEPFAAIIGYYFTKNPSKSVNEIVNEILGIENKYVLIFDWGGGTLDITVVNVNKGEMKEVGTAELTGLAGDKFDEIIAMWAWNKFIDEIGKEKYSDDYLETQRKRVWDKLLRTSEKCKLNLSTQDTDELLIEELIENNDLIKELTREEFSYLIKDIVDKACEKIYEALRQANINDVDLSQVLLTGGTCKIPVIQDTLIKKFGHRVESIPNSEMVIAQGAAVISAMEWKPFLTKNVLIEMNDGSYFSIFDKGMSVTSNNTQKTELFTCVNQQNSIAKVIVCDGMEQHKDSTLAIINVPVLADKRFGDDIEVMAKIDENIILHINARSKMVHGYNTDENYSIKKVAQVHKLCFGLKIGDK